MVSMAFMVFCTVSMVLHGLHGLHGRDYGLGPDSLVIGISQT